MDVRGGSGPERPSTGPVEGKAALSPRKKAGRQQERSGNGWRGYEARGTAKSTERSGAEHDGVCSTTVMERSEDE